jgi:signal transduction histidine kinase
VSKPWAARIGLIVLAAAALGAGTFNLLARCDLPVRWERRGGVLHAAAIDERFTAEAGAVRAGDVLRHINGQEVSTAAGLWWLTLFARPGEWLILSVGRDGAVFMTAVKAAVRVPPGTVILNQIVGLAFIVLGLFVWWRAPKDSAVRAFLRLNVTLGVYHGQNVLAPPLAADVYLLAWLSSYALVPAAFLDFLWRLTCGSESRPRLLPLAWRVPVLLLWAVLLVAYVMARLTGGRLWITLFSEGFFEGFGALLVVYVVVAVAWMSWMAVRPAGTAKRTRNRWLLLCTILGVGPFIFLNKLPVVVGGSPLLPAGAAMAAMLIAPIGWGMAVTSFRMLKVEWTLSRTIIYAITAVLLMCVVTIMTAVGVGFVRHRDAASLVVLILAAGFLALLAATALVDRVRWLVDRLYYGDWFDFERSLRNLSRRLSGSAFETDMVHILTAELPALLHLEKASLLIRDAGGAWISPPQPFPLMESAWRPGDGDAAAALEPRVLRPEDALSSLGYEVVVPLIFADRIAGWLLLGRKSTNAPYSARDLRLLTTLSSLAGTVLANYELHQAMLTQECRAVAADLAGGVAHEINNALSPLLGQAQLIQHAVQQDASPPGEKIAHSAQMIGDLCRRIQSIADNLNHLSQPVQPKRADVRLNEIAEQAIQILSETAGRIKRFCSDDADAPFRLVRSFDAHLPVVSADPALLTQVFMNLILNAADAMQPQEKGCLTVGTRYASDQGAVVGFVEDTGPGIPRHLQDRIFQPYFTTKAEGKGTGLGLAMVRSFVEAHGGTVRVRSTEGQGALFEFLLPFSQREPST